LENLLVDKFSYRSAKFKAAITPILGIFVDIFFVNRKFKKASCPLPLHVCYNATFGPNATRRWTRPVSKSAADGYGPSYLCLVGWRLWLTTALSERLL